MAVSIAVSRAREQDAESVSACLRLAFEPFRCQYTRGAFEDTVLNAEAVRARMRHMTVYVASIPNGDIIGTVASSVAGREGHLRGMAVVPAWQGHSVANDLLDAVVEDLEDAGCERLTLDTTAPLERAVRFYERNGFVASGKVTDFFGMPLYQYVKALSPRFGQDSHDGQKLG